MATNSTVKTFPLSATKELVLKVCVSSFLDLMYCEFYVKENENLFFVEENENDSLSFIEEFPLSTVMRENDLILHEIKKTMKKDGMYKILSLEESKALIKLIEDKKGKLLDKEETFNALFVDMLTMISHISSRLELHENNKYNKLMDIEKILIDIVKNSSQEDVRQFIEIPEGQVTLLYDGGYLDVESTFGVPTFRIAKYPVTNMEYRHFIKDGGYNKKQYWTEEGWHFKQHGNWHQPRYWNDTNFNQDNHPVVGISWYEAIAYCNWLSEKTKSIISLPTEEQWQRAAQAMPDGSNSGHLYPWGNEWDANKCNSCVEKESNKTTPINHYEQAGNVSPCGVVGMAGNTWEWCLTEYKTGNNRTDGGENRVVRGGSWYCVDSFDLCSTTRKRVVSVSRLFDVGFRCIRFS